MWASRGLQERLSDTDGLSVYLNLGVCYSTACVTVAVDETHLAQLAKYGMKLEITCYAAAESE